MAQYITRQPHSGCGKLAIKQGGSFGAKWADLIFDCGQSFEYYNTETTTISL